VRLPIPAWKVFLRDLSRQKVGTGLPCQREAPLVDAPGAVHLGVEI
jgi:hypothetical protein